MVNYKQKYFKYKLKYQKISGGADFIVPKRLGMGAQGVAYGPFDDNKVYKFSINDIGQKTNEEIIKEHQFNQELWKYFEDNEIPYEQTKFFQKTELKTLEEVGCFTEGSVCNNLFPTGIITSIYGDEIKMEKTDYVLVSDFYPHTLDEVIKSTTKEYVKEQLNLALKILHDAGFIHNDLNENQIRFKNGILKLIDFGKGIDIRNITTDNLEQIEIIQQIFKEKDLEKVHEIIY